MINQQFYYKLIKMALKEDSDNFLNIIMDDFIKMKDIPEEFVEQNKDSIDWGIVIAQWPETSYLAKIGAKFIPDDVWEDAIIFENLSIEFIREFEKYISWKVIAENFSDLSDEFKSEFKDKLIPHLFKDTSKQIPKSSTPFTFGSNTNSKSPSLRKSVPSRSNSNSKSPFSKSTNPKANSSLFEANGHTFVWSQLS